jgi:hypothetical protein
MMQWLLEHSDAAVLTCAVKPRDFSLWTVRLLWKYEHTVSNQCLSSNANSIILEVSSPSLRVGK